MKGTLKRRKNNEWIVTYWQERASSHAIHPNEYELPLHPDNVKYFEDFEKNIQPVLFIDEEEPVEFDIVEDEGNFVISGGLRPVDELGSKGLEYHYTQYAKLKEIK